MKKDNKKLILPFFASLIGLILILFYIFKASSDVIYSDYIRLTNSYIDNVFSIKKLITPDILTRMPISFLLRIINVGCFSYSIMFDRVVSALFLCLIFFVFAKYAIENKLKKIFIALIFFAVFSLNQWEMLLNGSGYCHYIAYFLFILYFYILDKTEYGNRKQSFYATTNVNEPTLGQCVSDKIRNEKNTNIILNIISSFTIIMIAGPYCATFVVCAIVFNIYKKQYKNIIFIVVPFVLYLISNHFAVYEHSGMKNIGLVEALLKDPLYPVRFILKAIASSVLGVESFERLVAKGMDAHIIYAIGIGIMLLYLFVFVSSLFDLYNNNIKNQLDIDNKKHISVFPLILLIMSIGNYLIVFLGRFAYMNDSYGMQSRYYLQYMIGTIAVILFFAFFCDDAKENVLLHKVDSIGKTDEKIDVKDEEECNIYIQNKIKTIVICLILILAFIAPLSITINDEIGKAPARKFSYNRMIDVGLNIENEKDEILPKTFEYNHDPQLIRDAFKLIKDKKLNIYK